MNDPAVLRKMIAELETENKKLKSDLESNSSKGLATQFNSSFNLHSS